MEVFFLRQGSLFCKDIWKSFLPFDIFQNAYFWDNMSTNGSAFWQHLHYFLLKNEYPIFGPPFSDSSAIESIGLLGGHTGTTSFTSALSDTPSSTPDPSAGGAAEGFTPEELEKYGSGNLDGCALIYSFMKLEFIAGIAMHSIETRKIIRNVFYDTISIDFGIFETMMDDISQFIRCNKIRKLPWKPYPCSSIIIGLLTQWNGCEQSFKA